MFTSRAIRWTNGVSRKSIRLIKKSNHVVFFYCRQYILFIYSIHSRFQITFSSFFFRHDFFDIGRRASQILGRVIPYVQEVVKVRSETGGFFLFFIINKARHRPSRGGGGGGGGKLCRDFHTMYVCTSSTISTLFSQLMINVDFAVVYALNVCSCWVIVASLEKKKLSFERSVDRCLDH